LTRRLKSKETQLPATGRDDLWTSLADLDPAKAQHALSQLAGAGEQGVAFLRERLKPATWATAQATRCKQLIADLDSDSFTAREKATEELGTFGELAEPSLRDVLKAGPSAEVRHRVETLLANLKLGSLSPERLRELRTLEILERIHTADARLL